MNRSIIITPLVLAALLGASSSMLTACKPGEQPETPEQEQDRLRAEALSGMQLVEFEATAPDGRRVTRDFFDGNWTLLSFGFTHCELACPMMHSNTIRVQSQTEGTDLQFVTMSVDPVHDTPERLAAYADRIGADPDRWTFLAMDAESRDRVLDGFGLGVTNDESEENIIELPNDAGTMNNIGHPTRLLLIGPDRGVVDLYPGLDGDMVGEIVRSIRGHMAG